MHAHCSGVLSTHWGARDTHQIDAISVLKFECMQLQATHAKQTANKQNLHTERHISSTCPPSGMLAPSYEQEIHVFRTWKECKLDLRLKERMSIYDDSRHLRSTGGVNVAI